MTRNVKKISLLIIAAVLVMALAFAGAASAAEVHVSNEADLRSNLTGTNTVILDADIQLTNNDITISSGTPTLDLHGYTITAAATERLFSVTNSGTTFTLNDSSTKKTGKLVGNGAVSNDGGGVYVSDGTFIMNGGHIMNCKVEKTDNSYGGGVYLEVNFLSTFTMNGGSIDGCQVIVDAPNTPHGEGGGVYVGDYGTFNMNGGQITNCKKLWSNGKGGYNSADNNVNKGEDGTSITITRGIFNNNGAGVVSGILPNNKVALINGGTTLMQYSSSTTDDLCANPFTAPEGQYFAGWATSQVGPVIYADKQTNVPITGSLYAVWKKPLSPYVEVNTWDELVENVTEWDKTDEMRTIVVMQDLTNPTGSNYDGIPVNGKVTIMPKATATGEVKIDANQKGRLFYVTSTGNLTLCGNNTATLNLTNGKMTGTTDVTRRGGAIYVNGNGNLTLSTGAKITNSTAYGGCAVYVDTGGTFNMNGNANITNCSTTGASGYGGGVYVNGGTFTMTDDASIKYCNATYYSGGVYVNGGTFTMNGGSITNCYANSNGGGVYITNTGTFNMNGNANITNCYAESNGGGVRIDSNCKFNMTGGNITNCNALTQYGGGVYVSGTFNMTGGTITNCNATKGGGVYASGSSFTFNMNGNANITNCSTTGASGYGGGVYATQGTFNMTGGSITNCNATKGGGVYQGNLGTFNVKGSAMITDNTNSTGADNNVYLSSNNKLNLVGKFEGSIGIVYNGVAPTLGAQFGTSDSTTYTGADRFFADTDAKLVGSIDANNKLVWTKNMPAYVEVNTWPELVANVTEWTKTDKMRTIVVMQDLTNETGSSNYDGIPVKGKVTIMPNATATGEVKIDANQKGRLFEVKTNGNLTLCGNQSGGTATLNLTGGKYTIQYAAQGGAIYINSNGNLTLSTGAKISNCTTSEKGGGVYVNGGTFNMNGGNITGCNAVYSSGGVGVKSGATFNMNGGSITKCNATGSAQQSGNGGGVYSEGTFNMTGDAKITNCNATCTVQDGGYGGGAYVSSGTFNMNGNANITGCSATGNAGGVYAGGTFNVKDSAKVTGNTKSPDNKANNIYLSGDNTLNLVGNFAGSIGIQLIGTNPPLLGEKFGLAGNKDFTGAGNFFADSFPLVGVIVVDEESNNLLKWDNKPLPAYVEVNTWDELAANVTEWTDKTKMRTIVLANASDDAYKYEGEENAEFIGIEVKGNVTITPKNTYNKETDEIKIDADKKNRLFKVTDGSLTLIGNDTIKLNLINGKLNDGGGGVFVGSNGNLTLANGAKITNCTSSFYGGGVYVTTGGKFTMSGNAKITGCNATGNVQQYGKGGGVYVNGGTFNMTDDAKITNCNATCTQAGGWGGGVFFEGGSGTFNMNGGNIENCTAKNGGGVFFNDGRFNVKDSATITGNRLSDNSANNVYLDKNNYLNLVGNFNGRIGIYKVDTAHPSFGAQFGLASSATHTGAGNFFADTDAKLVGSIDANNKLVWTKNLPAYVEVNTWQELVENVTEWDKTDEMRSIVVMQDLTNTTGTGNYDGIPVNGKVTIMPKSGAGEIKIDAKQKGRLFDVKTNGNLTLVGNGTATLNLTNGKAPSPTCGSGGAICVDGGNLTLANGAKITNSTTILNGGGVNVDNGGTFTMNGGNITGCNAAYSSGGVSVYNGATFTMNGGNITGCYTTADQSMGCGVFVAQQSTFTMNGGNITGCYTTADQCTGSAVGVYNGTVTMSGKAFIDANNDVYLCDGKYITLGGAFDSNAYGAFNITLANTTIGNVIVNGTTHGVQASTDNFKLSPALSGYTLKAGTGAQVKDLVLAYKEFNITYDLDGGVNASTNPATYNITSPAITLDNASKLGYTFEGWYNESSKAPAFRNNTIPTGSTGDKTFYANYTQNVTNVNFDYNGIDGNTSTVDRVFTFCVSPDMPQPLDMDGYIFSWKDNDGENITDSKYINPSGGTWNYTGPNGDTLSFKANRTVIETTEKANEGIAEFGEGNTTAIIEGQSIVNHVILENVSNVDDGATVTFIGNTSSDTGNVPQWSGHTRVADVTIFEIDVDKMKVSGEAGFFNMTVFLNDLTDQEKVTFWHYNTSNKEWDTTPLTRTSIAVDTEKMAVTYQVQTNSFSPFGITIEQEKSTPYVPSSHSKQTGSTVILKDGEVVPTVTPTATPGVPTVAPSTKPTTQPTQKSPAPFFGLAAGLGAALVIARMRR